MERRPGGRRRLLQLAQRLRRQEPPAAQEHRAHWGRSRLRRRPGAAAHALGWELAQVDPPRSASRHFRHEGRNRSVNPDAFGALRRGPATWSFFLEWEEERCAPRRWRRGSPPICATTYLTVPSTTTAPALRPDRLRRRHRRHQLPESGAGRDGPRRGQRAPVGLPQRGHRRAGPAGKGVEVPRRLGARPRPADPLNTPCGTGVQRRLPPRTERRSSTHGTGTEQRTERPPEAGSTLSSAPRRPVALGAVGAAEPLPELARPGDRDQLRLYVQAGHGRPRTSGRIRRRMLKALGMEDFHELFKLEEEDQDGEP